MHIILLILKIIGIVLLVILGILLFCVLLALFVPIRYRADILRREKIKGRAVVKWLFPAFYATAGYDEEKLTLRVRIFGIPIYPRKEKKKKEKPGELAIAEVRNQGQKGKEKKASPKPPSEIHDGYRNYDDNEKEGPDRALDKEFKKSVSSKEADRQVIPNIEKNGDASQQHNMPGLRDKKEMEEDQPSNISELPVSYEAPADSGPGRSSREDRENKGLIERIFGVFGKIKSFLIKFFHGIGQLKVKIIDFFETVKKLKGRGNLVTAFFFADENRPGLLFIWESVRKVLRHTAPVKIQGNIYFGTEDPCKTGQILGAISILYSYYGETLIIVPDFEKPVLEGELLIKGRIRLATLLRICIRLLIDDNFKQVKRSFEKIKEEL